MQQKLFVSLQRARNRQHQDGNVAAAKPKHVVIMMPAVRAYVIQSKLGNVVKQFPDEAGISFQILAEVMNPNPVSVGKHG